jgi:hypothetical protein
MTFRDKQTTRSDMNATVPTTSDALTVPKLPDGGSLVGQPIGNLPTAQFDAAIADLGMIMHDYAAPSIARLRTDTTGAVGLRSVTAFGFFLYGREVTGTVKVSLYSNQKAMIDNTYIEVTVTARQEDIDIVEAYTTDLEQELRRRFAASRAFGLGPNGELSFGVELTPAS